MYKKKLKLVKAALGEEKDKNAKLEKELNTTIKKMDQMRNDLDDKEKRYIDIY